jgi:nucleotide-binding universal stress UspA family protein
MVDPEPGSGAARGSVIVVGYSARAEGQAALQRAISEATLRGSSLLVVQTAPETDSGDLRQHLEASGLAHQIQTATDSADPAEDVLRAAETAHAEFIVIGLRRRSPVGKLLLGSNAQRVLLDAGCPVLAVKAPSS